MIHFTDDEHDFLKEVFNLAMGQAASGLAVLLKSFVDMVVPDIHIVQAEKVVDVIIGDACRWDDEPVTAIRQTFYLDNIADGEAIMTFDDQTFDNVYKLIGFEEKTDRQYKIELMLEMTNIIVSACLNGISNQLFGKDMSFVPPTALAENKTYKEIIYTSFQRTQLHWDYTMLAKISFKLKDESLRSELLLFISEKTILVIHKAITRMLAGL
ncbi:MCP methylation inhibitor CheC [Candidatus Magnetobacterium bavaricum]|uniref:MCP methylation inhibitor CheC n=1 Tax=Candidatus Magnetobacterium bavaricum TaxID=29290 RepID=A0A0F3GJN8_9BACT|nr:MCP methylation inhibitor CheC [Candidatus Magnetobacterium bavaricum]